MKISRAFIGLGILGVLGFGVVNYDSDRKLMTRIVYSEVATQGRESKRAVVKTILNRVKSEEFPDSIRRVVYQDKAFSCMGSNNWFESKFPWRRNDYEKGVYGRCEEAVDYIINGGNLGVAGEINITSFYSGKRPNGAYWKKMNEIMKNRNMTFCGSKKTPKI